MYEKSFSERLVKLRQQKNVSARDMSLSIGQNVNYINQIENNKTLPSMQVFFYICEYLNITPREFFEEDNNNPTLTNELIENIKGLDSVALTHIAGLMRELSSKKNKRTV